MDLQAASHVINFGFANLGGAKCTQSPGRGPSHGVSWGTRLGVSWFPITSSALRIRSFTPLSLHYLSAILDFV